MQQGGGKTFQVEAVHFIGKSFQQLIKNIKQELFLIGFRPEGFLPGFKTALFPLHLSSPGGRTPQG